MRAVKEVRRFRPDRILACWALPSGIFAAVAGKFMSVPYDVWCLGSDVWKAGDYPMGETILRAVLRRADRRFADGYGLSARVKAIGGLSCEFMPSCRPLAFLPRTAPVQQGQLRLVCVGRLHPDKGQDILIDALGQVKERLGDFQLRVFGDGPLRPSLEKQAASLGMADSIFFGGVIDEGTLTQELAAADVAVIPSRIESIPNIFSEALRASCPLIVTDVGDMGDLCRRYECGWVAKPDPKSLSEVIGEFAKEGRFKKLSENSVELKDIFDPVAIARQYAEKFIAA
jgi:glycosyltransferase involved in cell wall biosynthesis